MSLMEPFASELNFENGVLEPAGGASPERLNHARRSRAVEHSRRVIQRRLSDMAGMYADAEAVEGILETEGDRLIYEVHVVDVPEEAGQLPHCTTVIHPGRVGDEFHMTKGHFHAERNRAETYLGLAGEGYLLLQTDDGTVRSVPMHSGTVAYVPPYWAHRTVNTGPEPFIFLAVWPGDAGHDYGTIEETGFAKLLVARQGKPTLVANPRFAGG